MYDLDTLLAVEHLEVYLAVAAGVIVLIAIWIVLRRIAHRRHDRILETEVQNELGMNAPQELHAEVTVIPKEELPPEKPTVFMPVPGTVSDVVDFIDEARDGVCIRSFVRAEDVNRMMSGEQANALTAVVFRPQRAAGERAFVYLDTLSDAFAPYSFVNLTILKQNGLVGEEAGCLTVHARGFLRKPLMIEADEFSSEAVKMLSLTGGRAILIQS